MGVGPARPLPLPARQPAPALPLTPPTCFPHRAFLTPTPVITLSPPPGGPLDPASCPPPLHLPPYYGPAGVTSCLLLLLLCW